MVSNYFPQGQDGHLTVPTSLWPSTMEASQPPSHSCPTFSSPLSTGMRKRTSGSRLWYRSRTRFTSSGDGGTSGRQRKQSWGDKEGTEEVSIWEEGFVGMGRTLQFQSWIPRLSLPKCSSHDFFSTEAKGREKFTGAKSFGDLAAPALAGEEWVGGKVEGRTPGTFVRKAVQAAGDQRLCPLGAVFH